MNALVENYLPFVAFAMPVLVLAGMNLLLALGGERGTLLLPSARPWSPVRRAANALPAERDGASPAVPANDPAFHRAA